MSRTAVLLLALLPACATVKSGGFDIPAGYAETSFPRLKSRASFDLDCPAEQLTVETLNVYSSPGGNVPTEVGVRGCGRKAVYHPTREEAWLLDGSVVAALDGPAPAPPKPPSADKPDR